MTNGMGDQTRRSVTKDADDAAAIAVAPSKPMGQKIHNAAMGDPIHESSSGETSSTCQQSERNAFSGFGISQIQQ